MAIANGGPLSHDIPDSMALLGVLMIGAGFWEDDFRASLAPLLRSYGCGEWRLRRSAMS
jgi:hypothetical protein